MTEILRSVAEQLKRTHPTYANMLDTLAAHGEHIGVPATLPEFQHAGSEGHTIFEVDKDPFHTDLLRKIAQGFTLPEELSTRLKAKTLSPLAPEIADHFNRHCGGTLPDDTLLVNLRLPNFETLRGAPDEVVELTKGIPDTIRSQYTRVIKGLKIGEINTVGQLRRTSANELMGLRNLGVPAVNFAITAFRPLPQDN